MLYKYCTTDGFDILLRSRLKIATIEAVNDPFEVVFGVDRSGAMEVLKKEIEENPEEIGQLCGTTCNENTKHEIAEKRIKEYEEAIRKLRNSWNDKLGFICLSGSPFVIQMWAHYADNHTGIVVGLDEAKLGTANFDLVNVSYSDDMILLKGSFHQDRFDEEFELEFPNVLSTKQRNWEYEQEKRVYVGLDEKDADGNYYINIPPSAIREIYLGLRSHETAEIIAKSIKQRDLFGHLEIFKMRKDEARFELVPESLL